MQSINSGSWRLSPTGAGGRQNPDLERLGCVDHSLRECCEEVQQVSVVEQRLRLYSFLRYGFARVPFRGEVSAQQPSPFRGQAPTSRSNASNSSLTPMLSCRTRLEAARIRSARKRTRVSRFMRSTARLSEADSSERRWLSMKVPYGTASAGIRSAGCQPGKVRQAANSGWVRVTATKSGPIPTARSYRPRRTAPEP